MPQQLQEEVMHAPLKAKDQDSLLELRCTPRSMSALEVEILRFGHPGGTQQGRRRHGWGGESGGPLGNCMGTVLYLQASRSGS